MHQQCRFCLKSVNDEVFIEINKNISQKFEDITKLKFIAVNDHKNIVCEFCLKSLEAASVLKKQLIKNQKKYVDQHTNLESLDQKIKDEPLDENFEQAIKPPECILEASPHNITHNSNKTKVKTPPNIILFKRTVTKTTSSQSDVEMKDVSKDLENKKPNNQNVQKKDIKKVKDKKEFRCIECRKVYYSNVQLLRHIRQCHHNFLKCDLCPEEFSSKFLMSRHMTYNHMKSVKTFKCPLCTKLSVSRKTISEHINVYHKKRRYHCASCRSKFTRRDKCRKHSLKKHPDVDVSTNIVIQYN